MTRQDNRGPINMEEFLLFEAGQEQQVRLFADFNQAFNAWISTTAHTQVPEARPYLLRWDEAQECYRHDAMIDVVCRFWVEHR